MKKYNRISRIVRRAVVGICAAYLLASLAVSWAYDICPWAFGGKWTIATHRNGLLIMDVDADGLHMLNPLSNYGDDWIF